MFKRNVIVLVLIISASISCVLLPTALSAATTGTVEAVYPGLASGILTYAVPGELEEGVILKFGSLEVSRGDLDSLLSQIPNDVRNAMKKNLVFLLEQDATKKILLHLATERSPKSPESPEEEDALIGEYLNDSIGDIQISNEETATFYEENRDMFGGASLEQIRGELIQYLSQRKQQEMVNEYIRTLGRRHTIIVSADWTAEQASLAYDNAVDRARMSGKPSFIDFGADGCRPCDMMAPILENLKEKYRDTMNIEFIHVNEQQILAARYGIQSIPVQILFDENGKEVWRHTGFIPQERIEEQLIKIGIQP